MESPHARTPMPAAAAPRKRRLYPDARATGLRRHSRAGVPRAFDAKI